MCPRIFRLSGLRLKRLHVCHGCRDHFVNNANYAQEEITWKRQNKQLIPQAIIQNVADTKSEP